MRGAGPGLRTGGAAAGEPGSGPGSPAPGPAPGSSREHQGARRAALAAGAAGAVALGGAGAWAVFLRRRPGGEGAPPPEAVPPPTEAPPPPPPTPTPEPAPVIPPGDTRFGINEGFAAAGFARQLGARWTRWVVEWSEVQRTPSLEEFNLFYIDPETLRQELRHGYKMMAVLKSTPPWAQTNPAQGVRSVPAGLDLPVDDPGNTWAAFVKDIARRYAGRIDTWAIWNEVEIPPTGTNAVYNTWAGTLEQYYRLLKVAWQAAHTVNPKARILLSPYSYHKDKGWLERFLRTAARDPEAREHGFFFDILGLNLYRNAHDLYDRKRGGVPWAAEAPDRVGVDQILAGFQLQKPVWITEMNSMPYDETQVEGWDPARKVDGLRITQAEQASFVIQAYALGIAAGYETLFWQAMQDDRPPVPDELWGLVRYNPDPLNTDPARVRPAYTAYQVATRYLSDAERVRAADRRPGRPRRLPGPRPALPVVGALRHVPEGDAPQRGAVERQRGPYPGLLAPPGRIGQGGRPGGERDAPGPPGRPLGADPGRGHPAGDGLRGRPPGLLLHRRGPPDPGGGGGAPGRPGGAPPPRLTPAPAGPRPGRGGSRRGAPAGPSVW